MRHLDRITSDPAFMGGTPCVRGLRVTVGTIVRLVAAGRTTDEILAAYPYLAAEDIRQALEYAAWRAEERDIALPGDSLPDTLRRSDRAPTAARVPAAHLAFQPFPKRGGIVTNELINKLRDGDAY
jgi:uncharacterized protein (DUF433 family)